MTDGEALGTVAGPKSELKRTITKKRDNNMKRSKKLELLEWGLLIAFMITIVAKELERQVMPSENELRLRHQVDSLKHVRDSLQCEYLQLLNENGMLMNVGYKIENEPWLR